MCHTDKIRFFGETGAYSKFSEEVDGLLFDCTEPARIVAVLPDIYGLTDFYKGYASFLSNAGARVYLTNPWSEFGELPEPTREAAYARRQKLRDRTHCDALEEFLAAKQVDAIVGFCIGGNFSFEMARRGFDQTNIAIYPLPWGMDNQDAIQPAFSYMSELDQDVTILMGEADHLAGPDNIERIRTISSENESLILHLYEGSNHGFFTDIDGDDEKLKANAADGIDKVHRILFG